MTNSSDSLQCNIADIDASFAIKGQVKKKLNAKLPMVFKNLKNGLSADFGKPITSIQLDETTKKINIKLS